VLGKVEGDESLGKWHGHVTAVTVAPECRRQGLARLLMNYLERVSETHEAFFVDLFVRASNKVAIEVYEKLGYSTYQTVNKYYSGAQSSGEDALGMHQLM
jgi:N-terminal acetyltransferase B complex catalytic subunit